MAVYSIIVFLSVAGLAYYHLSLIAMGQTTNEQVTKRFSFFYYYLCISVLLCCMCVYVSMYSVCVCMCVWIVCVHLCGHMEVKYMKRCVYIHVYVYVCVCTRVCACILC